MVADSEAEMLRRSLQPMRIVAIVMILGSLLLLMISIVLFRELNQGGPLLPAGAFPLLSTISIVIALLMFSFTFVLPGIVERNAIKKLLEPAIERGEECPLDIALSVWKARIILLYAMLEGTVIQAALFYFLEGEWFVLIMPVNALAWMIHQLPKEVELREWLASLKNRWYELQQFSRKDR